MSKKQEIKNDVSSVSVNTNKYYLRDYVNLNNILKCKEYFIKNIIENENSDNICEIILIDSIFVNKKDLISIQDVYEEMEINSNIHFEYCIKNGIDPDH